MSNIYNFLISQKEKKSFFKYFSLTLVIFSIFFLNFSISNADEETNPEINPNAFEKGLISFTFDDGYKSIYTALNNDELGGFTGTVYMTVNELVGATECEEENYGCYEDYMTKTELKTLVQKGFEVGSHTRTHKESLVDDGKEKDFKYEINGSRLDLLKDGFDNQKITNLAYPFGKFSPSIIEKLKSAGFLGARTVDPDVLNFKNTNPFELHARQINSDTELEEVKGWINEAVNQKGWLILVIHEIEEVNCDVKEYCTTKKMLNDISSYIKSLGEDKIDVLTVSEGLGKMGHLPSEESISFEQGDIEVYTKNNESIPVNFSPVVFPDTLEPLCVLEGRWIESKSEESGVFFEQIVESGDEFKVGETKVSCSITGQNGDIKGVNFSVFVKNSTPLTIENLNLSVLNKEYNGNNEALAEITLTVVEEGDDVSVKSKSATFSDANVGNDKEVTITGLYLEGDDAEKYYLEINEITGVASILPRKLEVSVNIKDKYYDENTKAEVESLNLIGVIEGDVVSVTYDTATFFDAEVGDDKEVTVKGLSLEGEDAGNYSLEETITTIASILKKEEQGNGNTSSGGNSSNKSKKSSSGSRGGASGKVLGESTSETDSSEDDNKKESEEVGEVEENEKEESVTEENLSVFKFTRSLQIGSTGDDVIELQKRLQKERFFFGPITGYYGQLTFEAVQKYQAKNGILQAGVVGPITREKLNSNFSYIEGNDSLIQSKLELIEKLKELIKLLTLLEEVKR